MIFKLLRRVKKNVPEFSQDFKAICDQHAAMRCPVDDLYKLHKYLHGFGSSFSFFSTVQLSLLPPDFVDIMPKAESHEIFVQLLELTHSHYCIRFISQLQN